MVWAFLLAACVLLCLELGESGQCKFCLFNDPVAGCLTGNQGCHSNLREKCMTIKIMYEGKEKFRIQGCSRDRKKACGQVIKFPGSDAHTLKITCCSWTDCNE